MRPYLDQLASVQKAIFDIESEGTETEIEVNGNRRRVKREYLQTLYKREAWLLRMIDRENSSGYHPITPV